MQDVEAGTEDHAASPRPAPRGWRWLSTVIVAALGAGLAGAYAYFIGCETGSCPLTSDVWTASLYGSLVGAIVGWPGRRGTA